MHSPSLLLLTSPLKTPILLSGTPDCRVLILLYSCERTEHAYTTLTGSGSNPQFLTFTRSMDVRWGFHNVGSLALLLGLPFFMGLFISPMQRPGDWGLTDFDTTYHERAS